MPVFTIRRDVPGLTREDVDAASFRAISCAMEYPEMRWRESYWDAAAGMITCVYEARSSADIFEHARRARIPCDDVREVLPFGPGDYVEAGVSLTAAPNEVRA